MKNLISAYEKTLKNVAEALSTSLGRTAHWGIAGFREESLVFLLAETMRKLGPDPQYEPCFKDRTRADLCWPKDGKNPSILEAKWWWWSDSLRVVLDDIAAKTAFAKHRGERYGVVFSVDDANCTEGEKSWATLEGARAWMCELVRADQVLRRNWSYVGCAAARSPYFGTSWNEEGHKNSRRRDGIFVAGFYRHHEL
jgi:hypothetical protein